MTSRAAIKLSAPATREFWELPALFEDEHLLAIEKPARLPILPEGENPDAPSLLKLMHAAVADGKPWARERNLDFLINASQLDTDATGVLLFAKDKATATALANVFGGEKAVHRYLALVRGEPLQDQFEVDAKIAPHPAREGLLRVDLQNGKKAKTRFEVLERFPRCGYALLRCQPAINRPHQMRVHLSYANLKVAGDAAYGGKALWLSRLKNDYRLKEGREERPLIARAALHLEELTLPHPVTGETLALKSEWPKDLKVAVKYLRQYAHSGATPPPDEYQ